MTKPEKLEAIFEVISKQSFQNFYGSVNEHDNSPLTNFLVGEENALTKSQILSEIEKLFKKIL